MINIYTQHFYDRIVWFQPPVFKKHEFLEFRRKLSTLYGRSDESQFAPTSRSMLLYTLSLKYFLSLLRNYRDYIFGRRALTEAHGNMALFAIQCGIDYARLNFTVLHVTYILLCYRLVCCVVFYKNVLKFFMLNVWWLSMGVSCTCSIASLVVIYSNMLTVISQNQWGSGLRELSWISLFWLLWQKPCQTLPNLNYFCKFSKIYGMILFYYIGVAPMYLINLELTEVSPKFRSIPQWVLSRRYCWRQNYGTTFKKRFFLTRTELTMMGLKVTQSAHYKLSLALKLRLLSSDSIQIYKYSGFGIYPVDYLTHLVLFRFILLGSQIYWDSLLEVTRFNSSRAVSVQHSLTRRMRFLLFSTSFIRRTLFAKMRKNNEFNILKSVVTFYFYNLKQTRQFMCRLRANRWQTTQELSVGYKTLFPSFFIRTEEQSWWHRKAWRLSYRRLLRIWLLLHNLFIRIVINYKLLKKRSSESEHTYPKQQNTRGFSQDGFTLRMNFKNKLEVIQRPQQYVNTVFSTPRSMLVWYNTVLRSTRHRPLLRPVVWLKLRCMLNFWFSGNSRLNTQHSKKYHQLLKFFVLKMYSLRLRKHVKFVTNIQKFNLRISASKQSTNYASKHRYINTIPLLSSQSVCNNVSKVIFKPQMDVKQAIKKKPYAQPYALSPEMLAKLLSKLPKNSPQGSQVASSLVNTKFNRNGSFDKAVTMAEKKSIKELNPAVSFKNSKRKVTNKPQFSLMEAFNPNRVLITPLHERLGCFCQHFSYMFYSHKRGKWGGWTKLCGFFILGLTGALLRSANERIDAKACKKLLGLVTNTVSFNQLSFTTQFLFSDSRLIFDFFFTRLCSMKFLFWQNLITGWSASAHVSDLLFLHAFSYRKSNQIEKFLDLHITRVGIFKWKAIFGWVSSFNKNLSIHVLSSVNQWSSVISSVKFLPHGFISDYVIDHFSEKTLRIWKQLVKSSFVSKTLAHLSCFCYTNRKVAISRQARSYRWVNTTTPYSMRLLNHKVVEEIKQSLDAKGNLYADEYKSGWRLMRLLMNFQPINLWSLMQLYGLKYSGWSTRLRQIRENTLFFDVVERVRSKALKRFKINLLTMKNKKSSVPVKPTLLEHSDLNNYRRLLEFDKRLVSVYKLYIRKKLLQSTHVINSGAAISRMSDVHLNRGTESPIFNIFFKSGIKFVKEAAISSNIWSNSFKRVNSYAFKRTALQYNLKFLPVLTEFAAVPEKFLRKRDLTFVRDFADGLVYSNKDFKMTLRKGAITDFPYAIVLKSSAYVVHHGLFRLKIRLWLFSLFHKLCLLRSLYVESVVNAYFFTRDLYHFKYRKIKRTLRSYRLYSKVRSKQISVLSLSSYQDVNFKLGVTVILPNMLLDGYITKMSVPGKYPKFLLSNLYSHF